MMGATLTTGQAKSAVRQAVDDGLVIAWRNLKRVPRIPELAVFAILQSIMFVLLFAYVFGGAIPLPGGGSYYEYLMPGIFAQTIIFATATTAIGMTDDVNKGILDRFRSLPMARSAVLSGRTVSDVIYNGGILIVLMLSGLVVGWRVHAGILQFLAGVGLLLLFAFAMAWVGVWIGLVIRTVEVAQQLSFLVLFPVTFLSNIFVPTQTLPWFLRPIAEWNPASALTAACRELWGNPNPFAAGGLPAQHPVELTLAWVVLLLAIFAPLGVWRYRSMSRWDAIVAGAWSRFTGQAACAGTGRGDPLELQVRAEGRPDRVLRHGSPATIPLCRQFGGVAVKLEPVMHPATPTATANPVSGNQSGGMSCQPLFRLNRPASRRRAGLARSGSAR